MADLLGYAEGAGFNRSEAGGIMVTTNDPVLEWIATYPWPRGGVQARRVWGAYTLTSVRTGAPVARLKPLAADGLIEVLWWRRDAWGRAGPFGAVLALDDALNFIASEPAFWIRA